MVTLATDGVSATAESSARAHEVGLSRSLVRSRFALSACPPRWARWRRLSPVLGRMPSPGWQPPWPGFERPVAAAASAALVRGRPAPVEPVLCALPGRCPIDSYRGVASTVRDTSTGSTRAVGTTSAAEAAAATGRSSPARAAASPGSALRPSTAMVLRQRATSGGSGRGEARPHERPAQAQPRAPRRRLGGRRNAVGSERDHQRPQV